MLQHAARTTAKDKSMTTEASPARIYCGTYAKYNRGSIQGAWIDLADHNDKESFLAACAELHADESAPEFMFQDFEGFPRRFYSESSVPEALWDWLALDEDDRDLLSAYIEATSADATATIDDARDAFAGHYDSGADFAEDIAEETGAVPKDFPTWIVIDWEATWSCNLRFDYVEQEHNGKTYFFRNC